MNQTIKAKRSLAEIIAEKKLLQQQLIGKEQTEKESLQLSLSLPNAVEVIEHIIVKEESPTPIFLRRTLKEILAAKKAETSERSEALDTKQSIPSTLASTIPVSTKESFSLSVALNAQQLMAVDLAFAGKSFCLIGAAGTGKTTTQREIAAALLRQNKLRTHDFRIQGTGQRVIAPSIAFVAYTRIAAGNLRRAIHKDKDLEAALIHNITTIHNLLEYTPETYTDPLTGKELFRFLPIRNASNPLDITHLIIEEASMVGLDLWTSLFKALRSGVQIIFLGDINQLPPVFGASILSYAMGQLPIVELTEVYRQEGDSLILENAHNILNGRSLKEGEDFKILRGKQDVSHGQFKQALTIGKTIPKWEASGDYDPLQDIFLSPWNKQDLGTDSLNKWIAQDLGDKRNTVVWEILAGRNTLYLAVGDKVFYNKQVGVISKIVRNGTYIGKAPRKESATLTRFGAYSGNPLEDDLDSIESEEDYENFSLEKIMEGNSDEKNRSASHLTTLILETGEEVELKSLGDYSPATFTLAYALTVHKAQGCEWRRVFIILHKDHAISLFRELLYTAVTRARERVVIIAKDDVINRAIKTQRMKGNTLAEKIEYFNAGVLNFSDVEIIK